MDKPIQNAKFVKEIIVDDPQGGTIEMSLFKHENGGMFGLDSSYIIQCLDDDNDPAIPDPFNPDGIVILKGT